MSDETQISKELLERAYALSSDAETRALYRDWATSYDQTMMDGLAYLTPRQTAQLFASHQKDKSARILDVGSGTGLAGEELARLGFENIDALDYSPEMLGVARLRETDGRAVYKTMIEADLNHPLKLASESYDGMIATGLFTHAHVGASCLRELFRLLKPNSLFATTVHKDVWASGGFETTVHELEDEGILKTLHSREGKYFETDQEPMGHYIVWESLK
jgi:predicted TPR repeat methyltransferase